MDVRRRCTAQANQEAQDVLAIGVDTHKASLAACAIDELGRAVSERSFANDSDGHREFVRWLSRLPSPRRIGLEGSANFAFALAHLLTEAGEDTREVPAILTHRERRHTRRPGKCDRADALAIARVVARENGLPLATGTAPHRDLRLLVDYREQLLIEQTRLRNRLHADLQALLPGYRDGLGHLASSSNLQKARRLLAPLTDVAAEVALLRLSRLEAIGVEVNGLRRRIETLIGASHDTLTAIAGVGPLSAARLLGETGDPRRFRSAAAFAMTCGVAPIPASSGETQRHRLNRGGNRRLNRALHIVALTQVRCHPPARTYVERKRAEGKSWWEAMRCLKRHLADVIYRAMLHDQETSALTT
jgi:transposase